ncbi:hypothetical protein ELE36_11080 [Pseudolysobacter antarcticus]|uniref:Uncharacterized protein n=1 Tax=Pseudolysobacter antarcticus TaxID=2511995 RepID=A0A411HKB6_9GAMM|nr:hypothetical protein [Pseudolysobacter antarcticus]QBB70854.1 hypothetical protein ELE36_11080 [Pseudolysobacter antarcticus]
MKRIILLGALSLITTSSAFALELHVVNSSKSAIHHLYLTDSKDKEWGPDQLGDGPANIVKPGGKFVLSNVKKGTLDVRVVAEDGTECEIDDVTFAENMEWKITEAILNKCAADAG